jgi:urease accessory protein
MLTFTQRLPPDSNATVTYTLALTAEERTRSRLRFEAEEGVLVQLALPRGTVLRDGDLLRGDSGDALVRVRAKAEPVLTARTKDAHTLLRAAYHLGNRHVPVEVGRNYLRLSPDTVLAEMLAQLGLDVIEETVPFHPEAGAYAGHSHRHDHGDPPRAPLRSRG